MAQTNRVIIHHEGGGAPRDSWAGIDAEAYSIAIGSTRIEVRRSPKDSFVTDGTSGDSLQILLTGNRDNYPVTDNDLVLIDQACDEAQNRGWIPAPSGRTCQFHGDTAATACPGSHTRERRNDIYDVVLQGTGGAAPAPKPPSSGAAPPFPGTNLHNYCEGNGTATWQQQMVNRGWNLGVDDKYGDKSENVCRQFQAEKGLGVDGIVGPNTWNAAWTAPIT
jgi:peptidoglycan hydrolase-like protein with peptidoglycan-binding domain